MKYGDVESSDRRMFADCCGDTFNERCANCGDRCCDGMGELVASAEGDVTEICDGATVRMPVGTLANADEESGTGCEDLNDEPRMGPLRWAQREGVALLSCCGFASTVSAAATEGLSGDTTA